MTLTQLEYIIALDTHRHFAKASKNCFVTQPTLSMQIQKLEDELGIIIFDRSKQPVVPTEIGQEVIAQAREILQEAAKLRDIINDQKDEIAGELKIGIIPTLSPYLLPLFVTGFMRNNPAVKLIVEELQTEQILEKLKNEIIDAGILVTPIGQPGFLEIPLFYEPFVAYISKDHPLYKKKKIIPADLEVKDLWLLNQGHCFRSQMINICGDKRKNEDELQFEYESGSLETLKKLVERENGLTLLPKLAVNDLTRENKARVKEFYDPVPLREVSLIVRRSFLKKKLLDALKIEIIKSVPSNMVKPSGKIVKWQ